jgi:hypothetical protein
MRGWYRLNQDKKGLKDKQDRGNKCGTNESFFSSHPSYPDSDIFSGLTGCVGRLNYD